MKNIFATLFMVIFISGCAGPKAYIPLNRIDSKYSHIITKYDLYIDDAHKCLFAPSYNKQKKLQRMGKILSPKESQILNHKIENKIQEIHSRAKLINAKYKIIDKDKLANLKHLSKVISENHDSAFDSLENKVDIHKTLAHFYKIDKQVADIPIFIPVKNALVSSKFGPRKTKGRKGCMHKGLDIVGPKGSEVYAAANGVVIEVASSRSYGKYILIQHKKNLKTRYAHLRKLEAKVGQKISQGEIIGIQGSTGKSSRDHLHFEVIHKERHLDPINFIGKEIGCHKSKA